VPGFSVALAVIEHYRTLGLPRESSLPVPALV
jgi:hypothetical protein